MTTASSILLTTPLKTLKLIEATILLNLNNKKMTKRPNSSDSTAMISLDEWNLWVRSHEWSASATTLQMDSRERTSKHAVVPFPTTEWMTTLSNFAMSFSEEERLLFDLLLVSSNDYHAFATEDGSEQISLYPLYRLVVNNHKLYLEVLSSSSSSPSSAKDGAAVKSRMEVLGERYHQCGTFLRLLHTATDSNSHDNGNDSKEKAQCVQWCNHALKLAQMIHDYKINVTKPSQRSAPNKRNDSASSFVHSIVTNKGTFTDSVHEAHAHSNPDEPTQKLSLEERIRARAKLRELHNEKHKAKSTASQSGILHNNNHEKKRALLELADALRYFSQRRGVSSRSPHGGTALERLQSRVVNNGPSVGNRGVERAVTARLSITDFLQDARLCWNGILRNSTGSGSAKGGGSAASGTGMSSSSSSVVHVDLGRVLFHLRLNMTYDSTTDGNKSAAEAVDAMMVSDRRQMEKYLLNLLQELTTIVPNWISVSRIPATFSSSSTSSIKRKDPTFSSSYGTYANGAENTKSIITRDSLIVIRNDTVDYNTDVRAKLGGRTVSRPDTASNGSRKRTIEGDRKEQQQAITTKLRGKNHPFGPSVVTDAIVPTSFRQRYGKVIESACVKAATQKKK
ncbi:hypothetical protein HJC23_000097 [Cyclotella cryptica]|uniref:DNA replication regulator Sld3 C-terminal domain-containing protein n=1 Tax=Cyclotella cryptica TaxID=29204 RepID=A0ABD3P6T1_9STRA|eukprot:CCRYP_017162-RA/>CCRYP_017162-RA protein AED:0.21 eAED:0.21 QI:0/-1/0/1/-1/1/1/0/623